MQTNRNSKSRWIQNLEKRFNHWFRSNQTNVALKPRQSLANHAQVVPAVSCARPGILYTHPSHTTHALAFTLVLHATSYAHPPCSNVARPTLLGDQSHSPKPYRTLSPLAHQPHEAYKYPFHLLRKGGNEVRDLRQEEKTWRPSLWVLTEGLLSRRV